MARERAALARAEEARFRLMDAERRLEESLTVSFNALQAVNSRYEAVRAEYAANEQVAIAFREQLEAASRPLLDVLDAEERLFASKQEMLRLIVLKATLELQIHRLIGDVEMGPTATTGG